MNANEETFRALAASIDDMVGRMPQETQDLLVALKANIDGWAVDLRQAECPAAFIGALLFDNLHNEHNMERVPALAFVMAVLK